MNMNMNAFPVDNTLSLYIPHVFPNIDEERISRIFRNLDIGNISRVDFVAKFDRQGKEYNSAYIHFAQWFNTPVATNFQTRVMDPKVEAKLVYDDPWFWVILPNSGKKRVINGRKPCLDLGEPHQVAAALVLRVRPVVDDAWENYCNTYQIYRDALKKNDESWLDSIRNYHECVKALQSYYSSVGYAEEGEGEKGLLPFCATGNLNKAKLRVEELRDSLAEYEDCGALSRKEIFKLERMTREMVFLEEEIALLERELQNKELCEAVDAVEDQDYVEEDRYIRDLKNDDEEHYLTREEAQQRVQEIGRIIVEDYPLCPTAVHFGEIASLQLESEELKRAIQAPMPLRLIEDVIDDLLEEMEDCERYMDVADCV